MPLPELPGARILAAHAAGTALVRDADLVPEPPEVALAAERHRWAWAPSEVRVVLIAESPVYTSPQDFSLRVRGELLPPQARHSPAEFVRLIYCLGYGKDALLTGAPDRINRGTLQFWTIFGRLAGTLPAPSNAAAMWRERVAWEVQTLLILQAAGIWLLDASTHGVYLSQGQRLPNSLKAGLHRVWWEGYGTWLLAQLVGAERWIVGKTVKDGLEKLAMPFDGWIYQPQAGRGGSAIDMELGWPELYAAAGRPQSSTGEQAPTPAATRQVAPRPQVATSRTWFDVRVGRLVQRRLAKNRAILAVVRGLCDAGITPEAIAGALKGTGPGRPFRTVAGQVGREVFVAAVERAERTRGRAYDASRYFVQECDLIQIDGATHAFSNQWGPEGEAAIARLVAAFPQVDIDCTVAAV